MPLLTPSPCPEMAGWRLASNSPSQWNFLQEIDLSQLILMTLAITLPSKVHSRGSCPQAVQAEKNLNQIQMQRLNLQTESTDAKEHQWTPLMWSLSEALPCEFSNWEFGQMYEYTEVVLFLAHRWQTCQNLRFWCDTIRYSTYVCLLQETPA